MKKTLSLVILFLCMLSLNSFSQQEPSNINSQAPQINSTNDPDDQQINKDEGYGPNDVEYNEAEGEKADESKDATERK